jgi:hypothetical protein
MEMDNYLEDNDYFGSTKTKPSESEKNKNNDENKFVDLDYKYYTNRKSSKKIIGYVEKQD